MTYRFRLIRLLPLLSFEVEEYALTASNYEEAREKLDRKLGLIFVIEYEGSKPN